MTLRRPGPVVTGVGMISPAGQGVDANWKTALTADAEPAAPDPALRGLPWQYSCRVPAYEPQAAVGPARLWRFDRHTQFAYLAATEALTISGLDPADWEAERVAVICGTAVGGAETVAEQQRLLDEHGVDHVSPYLLPKCLPNMAAGALAIEFGARGPCLAPAGACASGSLALATAALLIRSGACDIAIAGGTDAAITPLYVTGLGRMGTLAPDGRCRPFDRDRTGFVVGEGAAMLVLERDEHARARGARPLARLAGCGTTADAHHVAAPDPVGAGAAAAIRTALHEAGAAPREVAYLHAHGTGTRGSDEAEAHAIRAALGEGRTVTSLKALTGHTLGAAGALAAAYTVLSIHHGVVPATAGHRHDDPALPLDVVRGAPRRQQLDIALCQALGFGGQNAALVLSAP
ncbi:beta-ketoacyl-[acyl-carrier-protein] synthase family protein [Streptomyces sp. Je 1-369]|uniref:beta-ketoacyl-[acyl-carrier-protein] synthase family protein n=1 Tax=Streptomyces sp. Je 1-369 TaxID=2966192 RepID=UPI0022863BBF|nr:beta-ketoacyl-[acyl-carrier-protein] synthase family protein [Streptomyces sp. Je 1-369]WAL93209.1 beta-ketoacyl-[acyl-carrier-protein] synthase family protein [Streptomyces sp. Je 1-369]